MWDAASESEDFLEKKEVTVVEILNYFFGKFRRMLEVLEYMPHHLQEISCKSNIHALGIISVPGTSRKESYLYPASTKSRL